MPPAHRRAAPPPRAPRGSPWRAGSRRSPRRGRPTRRRAAGRGSASSHGVCAPVKRRARPGVLARMSPRRSLLVRIVPAVLVTAATWCGAAAAPAATVSIPEDDEHGVDHVVFTGDPGEANDLTVTLGPKNAWYEPREIRFTDAGAPLAPGRFCTAVDLHTVTCVPEMT